MARRIGSEALIASAPLRRHDTDRPPGSIGVYRFFTARSRGGNGVPSRCWNRAARAWKPGRSRYAPPSSSPSRVAEREGRIVSRDELYRVVWGEPYRKTDRSVDVYVGKVRHQLEDAIPEQRFIHTHFGFGYRFAEERAQPIGAGLVSRS